MGYTTDFTGSFKFNQAVDQKFTDYINNFSGTRRMMRDSAVIKELFPNWKDLCFNGELGVDGEYFVGGTGICGQDNDDSVVDQNSPPRTQPGLWCQWVISTSPDGTCELVWDEGEKFYNYIEWLDYLLKNFIIPSGYSITGSVKWKGEADDDIGIIKVENNEISVIYF